jgi:nucleolar complex protein 2
MGRPLGEMNVDEFMASGFANILNGSDDDDESDVDSDTAFGDDAEESAREPKGAGAAVIYGDSDDEDDADGGSDDEDAGSDADGEAFEGSLAEDGSSDTDDDDDDDDDEILTSNSKKESEISAHKASLARMKEADPEFYKYLQENDAVRGPSMLKSMQLCCERVFYSVCFSVCGGALHSDDKIR